RRRREAPFDLRDHPCREPALARQLDDRHAALAPQGPDLGADGQLQLVDGGHGRGPGGDLRKTALRTHRGSGYIRAAPPVPRGRAPTTGGWMAAASDAHPDVAGGGLRKETDWRGAFVIGLAGTILVTGIAPVMVTSFGAAAIPQMVAITITGYLLCLLLAEL